MDLVVAFLLLMHTAVVNNNTTMIVMSSSMTPAAPATIGTIRTACTVLVVAMGISLGVAIVVVVLEVGCICDVVL